MRDNPSHFRFLVRTMQVWNRAPFRAVKIIMLHGKFLQIVIALLVASAVAVGVMALLKHRSGGLNATNPANDVLTPEQITDKRAAEECAIYSLVIKAIADKSAAPLLLINDQEALVQVEYQPPDQFLANLKSFVRAAADDTITDFVSQNKDSSNLKLCDGILVKFKLLNDKELLESIHKKNNFLSLEKEIHNRFPDSDGVITFSKIGFNKTFDQALLHVSKAACLKPCFSLDYVLLVKDGGAWKIQRVFQEMKKDELNLTD
jgi:hypothetical protein